MIIIFKNQHELSILRLDAVEAGGQGEGEGSSE